MVKIAKKTGGIENKEKRNKPRFGGGERKLTRRDSAREKRGRIRKKKFW